MPAGKIDRAPHSPLEGAMRDLAVRPTARQSRSESSRSSIVSSDAGVRAERVQGAVPLVRVDYGQPSQAGRVGGLSEDSIWQEQSSSLYMATHDGFALRAAERKYAQTTREVILSVSQIRGRNVLILGCGSSRHLLRIARDGPESMTFVDVHAPTVDRMKRLMEDGGYADVVWGDYVVQDAWDYLGQEGLGQFDLVLITKCLGQIYKTDPVQRTPESLFNALLSCVAEDGIVVVDHHNAFAGVEHGEKIVKHCPRGQRDRATIAGRFSDDVCYSSEVFHEDFFLVAKWCADLNVYGVQSWTQFVYRRRIEQRIPSVGVVEPVHDVVPVPFRMPAPCPATVDMASVSPRPFNGVKRVLDGHDFSVLPLHTAVPKFDGVGGVLLMGGTSAVFVSSQYNFVIELSRLVTSRVMVAAELVQVGASTAVVVVIGAISVANVECDPYSPADLDAVRPLLRPLAQDGIVCTANTFTSTIDRNDMVRIGPLTGRHVMLPVDGINLTINGRNGTFLKPPSRCTVDVRLDLVVAFLEDVYRALDFDRPTIVTSSAEGAPPSTVFEWKVTVGLVDTWEPVVARTDKKTSNTFGRTMIDVIAARASADNTIGWTLRGLMSSFR